MKRFSDKETAGNMFRGKFAVVPVVMIALFIWAILALFGLPVGLDSETAKWLGIGLPILFAIYWYLFKYYDRNNP